MDLGSIGGLVSGALPFLGSSALSLADNALQFSEQKSLAHGAQDFSAQQYANRYQITTADMKAAGLNPMLATTQGPGSSPSGVSGQAPKSDLVGAFNQTRTATAQNANADANTAKTIEDTKNVAKTGAQIDADTQNKLLEQDLIYAKYLTETQTQQQLHTLSNKYVQEIANMQEEWNVIKEKINTQGQTTDLVRQQVESEKQLQQLRSAQKALQIQQANINKPTEEAAKTSTAQLAAHGRNISDFLSPFTQSAGAAARFAPLLLAP
jgi:hypothetical protein